MKRVISGTATIFMVAVLLAFVGFAYFVATGHKAAVVYSGSMSPMLERGHLIFTKPTPAQAIKKGDVITFQDPRKGKNESEFVTHRVIKRTDTAQGPVFKTQGDANMSPDPWDLKLASQAGVFKFGVPWVGNLSFLVRSAAGFAVLFGVPLLLLMVIMLRKIWSSPSEKKEAPDPWAFPGVPGADPHVWSPPDPVLAPHTEFPPPPPPPVPLES